MTRPQRPLGGRTAHQATARTAPRRLLVGAAVALAAVCATSGCATVQEAVTHRKEQHFDVRSDAPTSGDLAFVLPDLVPADATSIDLRVVTDGPGAVLRYASDTPITDPACVAADLRGEPLLSASWWPADVPGTGLVCGAWSVFGEDGEYYGWKV